MEAKIGRVNWLDITVKDADTLSEFYKEVVGWEKEAFDMGDYSDYIMKTANGDFVSGICHAKGPNENLPPQWLVYISVENIDHSIAKCLELGGKTLSEKKDGGEGKFYCLVQDPAGAFFMLHGS